MFSYNNIPCLTTCGSHISIVYFCINLIEALVPDIFWNHFIIILHKYPVIHLSQFMLVGPMCNPDYPHMNFEFKFYYYPCDLVVSNLDFLKEGMIVWCDPNIS